jgi:predicted RNase H-like HicB family nuclease/DNA-binding XRE family transcriptional regulator
MEYAAKIKQNGKWWEVSFPDKPNVNTCGESLEHALEMAREALNGMLEGELEMEIPLVNPKTKSNTGKGLYAISVNPEIEIAYLIFGARQGKSKVQAAKALGISKEAYQRFETPLGNPTWETLNRVVKALGKRLEIRLS